MDKFKVPKKLYHISVISPENMIDGQIKAFNNETINGETVKAIWAEQLPAEENPYSARIKEDGMFCFDDIIIYHKCNIDHKCGCLNLKQPLYQYEVSSDGFEAEVRRGTVEFIKKDGPIDLKDTEISKVEDVSLVCQKYQLFSNITDDKNITLKLSDFFNKSMKETGDYKKSCEIAKAYIKQQVAEGNIIYHNEYVQINERNEFCKEEIKDFAKNNLKDISLDLD